MSPTTAATSHPPESGWAHAPREVLRTVAAEFDIRKLHHDEALDDVRQTGFAHTRREGVICLAMNREYFMRACNNPDIRAIITLPVVAGAVQLPVDKAVIVCPRAEELYLYLHAKQTPTPEDDVLDIHPSATLDASAVLRGQVRIGPNVRIGPRVVVSGPATIQAGARLDAGVIVGCEGLYAKIVQDQRLHIPHFGGVEIGVGAFVHAGAIIVRSALRGEATRIGNAAHIGVMTNIGHDVEIGDMVAISSNCVIAGRARIGARAWIGASATVSNAISVGAGAKVRLGAVVIRDVPDNASVSGNFAVDHAHALRRYLKETGP